MKGISQINNFYLKSIEDHLRGVSQSFEQVSYTHIYRKLNFDTNILSKEGQSKAISELDLEETKDGIPNFSMLKL
jgi:hypothetical protein